MNPTHCKQLNLFSVAKVIETVASSSNACHISQKTSSSASASIVVSTQQPLTMTTLATTVTPSSNSNLPAVSSTPVKKQRPKTASPTRHGGPQQCQVTFTLLLLLIWWCFYDYSSLRDAMWCLSKFSLKRIFRISICYSWNEKQVNLIFISRWKGRQNLFLVFIFSSKAFNIDLKYNRNDIFKSSQHVCEE